MRVLIGYDGPAMLPAREDFDRRAAAGKPSPLPVAILPGRELTVGGVATEFSDAAHLAFSVSHRRVLARVWNPSGCGRHFRYEQSRPLQRG